MTEAEKRLWFLLRGGRFGGVKFKRQVQIGPYIVDFASLSFRLIIGLMVDSTIREKHTMRNVPPGSRNAATG